MMTKEEFIKMWDNSIEKLKKIYFITKSDKKSGIIANNIILNIKINFKNIKNNILKHLKE